MWAKKNFRRKFDETEFKEVEYIANQHVLETRKQAKTNQTEPTIRQPSNENTPARQSKGKATPTTNSDWQTLRPSKKRGLDKSPNSSPSEDRNKKQCKTSGIEMDFGFGSRFRTLEEKSDGQVCETTETSIKENPKRKRNKSTSPTSSTATPKKCRQEHVKNTGASPTLASPETPVRNVYAPATTSSPPFKDNRRDNKIPFRTSSKVQSFDSLNKGEKGKKVTEKWYIPKIEKNILALGTSNFRRIEEVKRDDVQVVSYSGMKLDHLIKIIDAFAYGPKSLNPGMQPAHVITMCGLNDMNLGKGTNKVNISKLYSALKKQFPNSKLSLCQLPMEREAFSAQQVDTIRELNNEIQSFCDTHSIQCIPRIDRSEFEVDPADPIHWTPTCANKTIEHILAHLN